MPAAQARRYQATPAESSSRTTSCRAIKSVSACRALATAPTGGASVAQACPVGRMIRRVAPCLTAILIGVFDGRDRAIGEKVVPVVNRREGAGDRGGGDDRLRGGTLRHHHAVAGDDVGRDDVQGKVAGVQAIVTSSGGGRYRVFFAQEVGHSVVEAVRDLQEGLA